ncbi:hypothetical protein DFH29DRAFT_940432 [Suillus ampliporus]|nr:hypothetical protein DFH29DRAFT_940432 [Suillus ampliporus]
MPRKPKMRTLMKSMLTSLPFVEDNAVFLPVLHLSSFFVYSLCPPQTSPTSTGIHSCLVNVTVIFVTLFVFSESFQLSCCCHSRYIQFFACFLSCSCPFLLPLTSLTIILL